MAGDGVDCVGVSFAVLLVVAEIVAARCHCDVADGKCRLAFGVHVGRWTAYADFQGASFGVHAFYDDFAANHDQVVFDVQTVEQACYAVECVAFGNGAEVEHGSAVGF